jgi:hypothetical protein
MAKETVGGDVKIKFGNMLRKGEICDIKYNRNK